jgi:Ca2+-binding RTX toxin-like protein
VNGAQSGAAYVIYGKAGGFSAALNVSSLDGSNGFRLDGPGSGALAGGWVSAAGDINNDGADDVIVGARGAGGTGAAYIVFGDSIPLTLTGGAGANSFTGSRYTDTLSGEGGNDVLRGMAGDDHLDGGDMGDQLHGGDGADTLLGGDGGDVVEGDNGNDVLNGEEGADKLFGGANDDTLDGGVGNDRLDGGAGNDILSGGDGNDLLDGGGGSDFMLGGLGNDIYVITDFPNLVSMVEAPNGGYDIVRAFRTWQLGSDFEALELQGTGNYDGYGNSGANNIQGNSGRNQLQGLDGVDTLDGGGGNDVINGGRDNDLLRGGAGKDTFMVSASSVGRATLETDQIFDFSIAEQDVINLSQIDAIAGGADNAFTFVGTTFTRHAGEMTLSFAAGVTTLRLDVNGDGKVDYQMKINGDVTGDSGRWIL